MTKYLISILGPTGIGKTTLSVKLAAHLGAEIISCDSRQFFKEMTIGTAVPTPEELETAPHHLIQHLSIFDNYSVGQFEREAIDTLSKLYKKGNLAVMVGGSGLYANAVLYGLDTFPDVSPELREELNNLHEQEGLSHLQEQLKALDPVSYKTIAIDNPHRVIRALEICLSSGKPFSSFKNQPKAQREFIPVKIGLKAERSLMYDRINSRVDLMMAQGLLEEAEGLLEHKHLNALQTVGYKELFAHLEGKCTLEQAVEEIKKNTRRFAKRQVTWNRKDTEITWFDYNTPIADIIDYIEGLLSQ